MAWCCAVIEAPGVVERIDGDSAWVRLTEIQGGCGRCHEPGGCGGARIAHAFGRPDSVFRVDVDDAVQVGQPVLLVADEGAALGAAMVSYGASTLLVLLSVGLGTWLVGETGAVAGLLIALTGSVAMIRQVSSRQAWARRLNVSMRAMSPCSLHD